MFSKDGAGKAQDQGCLELMDGRATTSIVPEQPLWHSAVEEMWVMLASILGVYKEEASPGPVSVTDRQATQPQPCPSQKETVFSTLRPFPEPPGRHQDTLEEIGFQSEI